MKLILKNVLMHMFQKKKNKNEMRMKKKNTRNVDPC